MRRILDEEGFSRFRYKCVTAIEPSVDNPLAAILRTKKEVQMANGLLAGLPAKKETLSMKTKKHLFLGLQALASGTVKGDDQPAKTTATHPHPTYSQFHPPIARTAPRADHPPRGPGWQRVPEFLPKLRLRA